MRNRQPWSNKELSTLRTCSKTHTIEQVARIVGRKPSTVNAMIRRLGISYQKPGRHAKITTSTVELQAAVQAYIDGEPMKNIATRIGVPYITVYRWCTGRRRWQEAANG